MKHVVLTAFVLASIGTIANACGGGEHEKEAEMSDDEATAFLVKAVDVAAQMHSNHRRNNSFFKIKKPHPEPFINTLAGIASILTEEGHVTDTVTLAAAYLHMVVRKTVLYKEEHREKMTSDEIESMFKEIGKGFNQEVEDLVRNLTSMSSLDDANKLFCDQIKNVDTLTEKAKVIRLAAKIYFTRDNIRRFKKFKNLNARRGYAAAKQILQKVRGTNKRLEKVLEDTLAELKADKKAVESSLKCQ